MSKKSQILDLIKADFKDMFYIIVKYFLTDNICLSNIKIYINHQICLINKF